MAISLVQHASGLSASNTVTITLSATGSGNALIIAATYLSSTDSDLQSVTLGGSGTGFSSQLYVNTTDVPDTSIWANFSIAGGQTSLAVTVPSGDSVTALAVDAYEVSGGLTALDKTAHQEVDGTSGSWTSTATATTTVAAEFILGVVTGFNGAGPAFTFTGPSSPWVNETQINLVTGTSSMSGYQIAASEAAFTYSGTANTTGTNLFYLAAVATFKGPVSGSTGPKFYPRNSPVQARRQRLPQQGRIRSNPGGPPSTHVISTSGGITFRPFGFQGYSLSSYGLLVTTQAVLLLDAILLQQPAGSTGELALRLGSDSPTATTPMTEIPGQTGYEQGGTLCAFNAASGGTASNSTALSWTNSGAPWEVLGLELWDPDGGGEDIPVRWLFADWNGAPVAVAAGNTFVIPPASLQISLS